MITYADDTLYPAVRELWDKAFGEDKAFNDYFFENIFDIKNVLVYTQGGRLLAMTQTPSYEINGLGGLTYIYGAATQPEYRGKGIMTKLLEHSFKLDRQKGLVGSMLVPANEPLFDFYARFGYRPAFFVSKNEYTAQNVKLLKADVNDWQMLDNIYEKNLAGTFHVLRTKQYWQQQIKMFYALGGCVYRTKDAYAFCWGGEDPEIQELMGSDKKMLAGGVAAIYKKDRITASAPGSDVPLGVVKLYAADKTNMYFNLMFN